MLQNRKIHASPSRLSVYLVAIASGLVLSACSTDERHQYLGHSDKIYNTSGEAPAGNVIAQTVDPWSPHSLESESETDGQRATAAIDRYQKDQVRQAAPPNTQ